MTEKLCPYCKGAGFQMLATRAATPHDKDKGLLIEERLGGRVVIEAGPLLEVQGYRKDVGDELVMRFGQVFFSRARFCM